MNNTFLKYGLLAALLSLDQEMGVSQQILLNSQYFNNPFINNPAFAGSGGRSRVFVSHRSQWTDMPGAPVASSLTFDGPLNLENIGLGAGISNQVLGISSRTSGFAAYAYRLKVDETKILRFGIAAGAIDNRIDFSKAIVKTISDPSIFGRNQRKVAIDVTPGLAFSWKDFEIGFSVPQALNNPVRYVNNDDQNSFYTFRRHYLTTVSYSFFLNREANTYFMPCFLLRAVSLTTTQYDANLVFGWKNIFWVSASYRSDYAAGLGAGFSIHKSLGIGYTYDLILSPVSSYAGLSHEFVVSYTFGGKNEHAEKKMLEREQEVKDLKERLAKHEEKTEQSAKENEIELLKANTRAEKLKRDLEAMKKAMNDSLAKLNKKISETPPTPAVVNPEPQPPIIETEKTEPQKLKANEVIKTSSQKDYKSAKGTELSKGFYIIIGSYKNKEYAERAKQENIQKGYRGCETVYNNRNRFTYVYISSHSTREEALSALHEVKSSGFPQAWVQELR